MLGDEVIATVTSTFEGVPDGQVYPVKLKVGDTVRGDLAEVAVSMGKAKWVKTKLETKVETKVEKKTGGLTGRAKPSSSQPAGQAKTRKTSKRSKAKPS